MSIMIVGGKVNDMFSLEVDGTEYDGYVPRCSIGNGDYIHFAVDTETGQIVGWKNPLNDEEFRQAINYNHEGEE